MNEFRTQFSPHERIYSESGRRIVPTYSGSYDSKGRLIVKQDGEHDLFSEIQSHKEECDIHFILSRYLAGDEDALNRVQGWYGDVTVLPKTFAEMFNFMERSRKVFDQLSIEVKSKFGNSFEQFLAASQQPDFLDILGFKKPAAIVEKESDSNESEH